MCLALSKTTVIGLEKIHKAKCMKKGYYEFVEEELNRTLNYIQPLEIISRNQCAKINVSPRLYMVPLISSSLLLSALEACCVIDAGYSERRAATVCCRTKTGSPSEVEHKKMRSFFPNIPPLGNLGLSGPRSAASREGLSRLKCVTILR